jgi:hypothetical protein
VLPTPAIRPEPRRMPTGRPRSSQPRRLIVQFFRHSPRMRASVPPASTPPRMVPRRPAGSPTGRCGYCSVRHRMAPPATISRGFAHRSRCAAESGRFTIYFGTNGSAPKKWMHPIILDERHTHCSSLPKVIAPAIGSGFTSQYQPWSRPRPFGLRRSPTPAPLLPSLHRRLRSTAASPAGCAAGRTATIFTRSRAANGSLLARNGSRRDGHPTKRRARIRAWTSRPHPRRARDRAGIRASLSRILPAETR